MANISKIFGVDLGTTNSVAAVMEGGQPTVVNNTEGLRTTPSIVAYTKNKDLLVGQIAKRQAVINPENTFSSIKRFMGSKFSELSKESKEVSYKLVGDNKDNVKIVCSNMDKQFSPEEISSQILRKLSNDVSLYMGQTINEAVITVPAYFNDAQRQATRDAGRIAGLEVKRIINEPTAASLAYGLEKKNNELVIIFDLGGGTFDVSLLEVGDGVFEVLSTSGDTKLGGDDFDRKIVDFILAKFQKAEGINLASDPQALQRLTEAAEKAKIELSNLSETTINLPFITANQDGPKHIEEILTRGKFEELCEDLINRCRLPVEAAIKDARVDRNTINELVLVGGSTRIPAVQNLVYKIVEKEANQTVNPDEVVAIGAAVQGGVLAGEVKNILLLDVTPLSLGVETLGSLMTVMIPRNTTIPVKKSETFSTATDNQESVDIEVLQGERKLAKDNKSLGNFRLEGIPLASRGVPQIEVTFDINASGILSVTAKDKGTGKTQRINIQNASTLDKDEVEKMIKNAEESSKIDKEKKEKIDLKNQADLVCYQNEKQLKEYEDKISLEKKELLLEGIKGIRDILQNEEFDNEDLKNKLEELQKISQTIGEDIASSANPEVKDESQTNSDETVIDTDFTDD
uniref:Chaperone protein DnaK n=3 Tax=Saccharina TaxID=309357 RepID=A0A8K1ST30_9PHAE|nr:Hsp70-type chaperone [Saccharina japonica]YP_010863347.1 Hsp70-type chaperone [Saccharina japonica x Saccharina latissima]QOV02227.1 Hsp70-type chaperone [Saccharina sp. ye-B]UFQ24765.1 Hsp70-type chaperone [Saccharina sp. Rongfu]WAX38111.1 heat shock protein 70 [Saccharina japonica cultivar 901]AFC40090.1 Hsp70-type chaperone [Saccharina japonica]UFQ24904.1 Hsp70-type chaperone [Saccharina sp. Rongfu]